jgi:hypothetical protein
MGLHDRYFQGNRREIGYNPVRVSLESRFERGQRKYLQLREDNLPYLLRRSKVIRIAIPEILR